MTGPCTCGVKFTGGLCSSWCDSLRPAEPEPAAERGKPHFNPMFLTHFYAPPQAVPVWPGYNMGPFTQPPPQGQAVFIVDRVSASGATCELDDKRIVASADLAYPDGTRPSRFTPGDMVIFSPAPKP
jgi:hypothetical protein